MDTVMPVETGSQGIKQWEEKAIERMAGDEEAVGEVCVQVSPDGKVSGGNFEVHDPHEEVWGVAPRGVGQDAAQKLEALESIARNRSEEEVWRLQAENHQLRCEVVALRSATKALGEQVIAYAIHPFVIMRFPAHN